MTRLPENDGQRIDREQEVSFTFDGKPVAGLEGDTIGSALFAAGRRTFSRSFKYHRPRGLLCCAGQCPNCLVAVDGAPGVRACTEPVREGMKVEHMNASPSLEFDVMRATDKFGGPFTPPGFYYKTFIRPRRFWPLYEKVLRHAAGLGRIAKSQPEREWRTEYRRRHADVLVVGGGAAGLSAALAAAEQGADVVLCDEGPEPGGRLLAEGDHGHARELAERAREAGVELLASAPALGAFDGLVAVWEGDTLHQIRAGRIVYATGAIEQPLLFPGNDLPGVMLSGGAPPAGGAVRSQAGRAGGGGSGLRPRAGSSRGPARRGRGAGRRGRPARERRHPGAERAAEARGAPAARDDRARGARPRPRAGRGDRQAGRRGGRARLRLRSRGGVGWQRAGDFPADPDRRAHRLRPRARLLRAARAARRCLRGGRGRGRRRARRRRTDRRHRGPSCGRGARIRRGRRGRPRRSSGAAARGRRAAPGDQPARGQVLRLPVRGRDREGHPPLGRGGLRLDRAVQALHDHHDGPMPGPHVPAAGGASDGPGDRPEPRAGRDHDRAAALARRADGRARGPALRAGQALGDSRPPPRAGRHRDVGGRLAARVRLRRRPGRGAGGARDGRADRRIHARQADRARARRRASSSTASIPTASRTSSRGGSATA